MFFKYDIDKNLVEVLDETSFASNNILEREHIEKWVEEYPDILGESFLILDLEYDQFDKTKERLDVLALDKGGKLVIIELKRDNSGKNVDLQALKYAAHCSNMTMDDVLDIRMKYLSRKGFSGKTEEEILDSIKEFVEDEDFEEIDDKPRILLVAHKFRPEVTSSVLWLRKYGLDISCIKLTPYRIDGKSLGISSSKIIPLPDAEDYIIRSEKKEIEHSQLTKTQKQYHRMWSWVRNNIQLPEDLYFEYNTTRNYFKIPVGISRVHFELVYKGRSEKQFGVELHFENGDRSKNLPYFTAVDSAIRKNKKWGELYFSEEEWRQNWCRLGLNKETVDFAQGDKEFVKTYLVPFINYCYPILMELHEEQ